MEEDKLENMLHFAWSIICNVGSHDGEGWSGQHGDWQNAVVDFREQYHDYLNLEVKTL